jgi:hypothetical protein
VIMGVDSGGDDGLTMVSEEEEGELVVVGGNTGVDVALVGSRANTPNALADGAVDGGLGIAVADEVDITTTSCYTTMDATLALILCKCSSCCSSLHQRLMYPPQQQRVLLQLTVQQPGPVTVQLTVLQDVQGDGVPGIGCAVHQPISPQQQP